MMRSIEKRSTDKKRWRIEKRKRQLRGIKGRLEI